MGTPIPLEIEVVVPSIIEILPEVPPPLELVSEATGACVNIHGMSEVQQKFARDLNDKLKEYKEENIELTNKLA